MGRLSLHRLFALVPTTAAVKSAKRRWALIIAVAFCGVAISALASWRLWSWERQAAEAQFQRVSRIRFSAVRNALVRELGIARALAALFYSSELVVRHEFPKFTRWILREERDLKALAWIPRVPAAARDAHEKEVRQAGFPSYEITQRDQSGKPTRAGQAQYRGLYYPVLFVEARTSGAGWQGFDFGSDPALRTAIIETMATWESAVALRPALDGNAQSKKLLYVALAAQNEPDDAVPRPPDQPLREGFVVAVVDVESLLERTLASLRSAAIDVMVTARSPQSEEEVFVWRAASHGYVAAVSDPSVASTLASGIELGRTVWTVHCASTDAYLAAEESWWPAIVLMAGLLFTALLVGYFILLTGRTLHVEQLVAARTREVAESEKRFRRLVENAGDNFFLRSAGGDILDVNKRACESLGYSREELLLMNVRDLDPRFAEVSAPYAALPIEQFPVTFETCHRRKNGTTFPVEIRVTAMDTEHGRLVLALARDITARKLVQAELQREGQRLREMLELHDRDRKLVAYEIHDGLAQQLVGALYRFDTVAHLLDGDPQAARAMFDSAVQLLREALAETRRLISGLRPPVLDECGVAAAVEALIAEQGQQGGPEIAFVHDLGFDRLPSPLESAAFRIIQECLTNARRHSKSRNVRVELTKADGHVRIDVRDWGVGFQPGEAQGGGHFGLPGICERARLLGGSATIDAAPHRGTHITVDLPLPSTEILA